MIIVGAKGLAKEVLEIFAQRNQLDNLYFFDDLSQDTPDFLFGRFRVIRSIGEVSEIFRSTGDPSFTLGVGKPEIRHRLYRKFMEAAGELVSAISINCEIGSFGNTIGKGCTIMSGAVITNGVTIGEGCLINPLCSVSHDSILGDFVEMSPGARVTGQCRVGNFSVMGTNSVVLPGVSIGKNVIVGAGAVVTRDVSDNHVVAGVPAVIKRSLPPLAF